MKIRFSGEIEFPERPDDRGSVDVWLLNTLEGVIRDGPELDDIYEHLKLRWEEV